MKAPSALDMRLLTEGGIFAKQKAATIPSKYSMICLVLPEELGKQADG
jgi:hypothetical protein